MWYHFTTENSESTNQSGFSAVPNGYLRFSGDILYHGGNAYFWCLDEDNSPNESKYRIIHANEYGSPNRVIELVAKWNFAPSHYYTYGFSVRCVKD